MHRFAFGITDDDYLIARRGFVAGGRRGTPSFYYPSPERVAIFDDFNQNPTSQLTSTDTGGLLASALTFNNAGISFIEKEAEAGIGTFTHLTAVNGVHRSEQTTKPSAKTAAGGHFGIIGEHRQWKPNMAYGGDKMSLRYGVRLKLGAYRTLGSIFMGFTDDTGTVEMPVSDTGATAGVISPAADYMGFLFGSNADTGWRGVSGQNGTDQEVLLADAGENPDTGVYHTYEFEFVAGPGDTGGRVIFYIDGIPKGSIGNPITQNVGLTPIVLGFDTGANAVIDTDWVAVSAPRDTGT